MQTLASKYCWQVTTRQKAGPHLPFLPLLLQGRLAVALQQRRIAGALPRLVRRLLRMPGQVTLSAIPPISPSTPR